MANVLTPERIFLGGFLYDPLSSRRNCVVIWAYVRYVHMLPGKQWAVGRAGRLTRTSRKERNRAPLEGFFNYRF